MMEAQYDSNEPFGMTQEEIKALAILLQLLNYPTGGTIHAETCFNWVADKINAEQSAEPTLEKFRWPLYPSAKI